MARRSDETAPLIQPRYLATDTDRQTAIGGFRYIRRMTQTEPLRDYVVEETSPGGSVQTDEEILDA